jgi:hypothetical protein
MSVSMQPAPSLQTFATRFGESIVPQWLWAALAGMCGATLGFFAWYTFALPFRSAASAELSLLLSLPAGALVTIVLWSEYGRFFSKRTGLSLGRSLQYDAVTWLPFLLLWATFVLPPQITQGSRLSLVAVALFCLVKIVFAARFNQTVREVLLDFVATRAAIIVIAELAAVMIGQRPGTHVEESQHVLLSVWGRWDAVHYIDIATRGYLGTDMAFFPLYPLLIRLLGAVAGNHLIAGLLISNASFFFGLLFLYRLLEREYDRSVARRAIFYVSIFPTAVFFSAVYTESLFFMLTVASFYYMRAGRWWIAGAVGFFAALSRVEGVLLIVPFAMEWFSAYRARTASLFDALAAALIPLGLVTYMAYLWVLRADPLYFSHVQIHWNRHLAFPWVSVVNAFEKIAHATSALLVANQSLELAFTLLMLAVLAFGWRSLRPSYVAYMALSILVPMSTSSLMSMPRFALVLFPMFVIFARWGERRWVNNLIPAFSLPLLGLYTVLFANWYWVA